MSHSALCRIQPYVVRHIVVPRNVIWPTVGVSLITLVLESIVVTDSGSVSVCILLLKVLCVKHVEAGSRSGSRQVEHQHNLKMLGTKTQNIEADTRSNSY